MPIYVPKQIVPITPTVSEPLIFLAGPIRGGGDWQGHMADHILSRNVKAHIACPSRWDIKHWLANHFYQSFTEADNRQLVWERRYLWQAGLEPNVPGCVIVWLGLESLANPHPGPEPYAMDTRREVGKLTGIAEVLRWFPELANRLSVRMVVGGDPGFHGLNVIRFELSKAFGKPFPFYESMAEVADQALLIAQQ